MNAKSRDPKPASHQPNAAAKLHAPLARLLRPLVRLCIRSGMTFPASAQLLRELRHMMMGLNRHLAVPPFCHCHRRT